VDTVTDHGEYVTVSHTGADGTSATARAARAFICIGFCPNVEGIGLDTAGVRVTAAGAIDINDYMRTSAPHIYAIGDVTAKVQLAHVASAQGLIAAETIAGVETMPLDYRMMPRVTFCQLQVASFGYTEEQARAAGHRLRVATFPCRPAPKPTDWVNAAVSSKWLPTRRMLSSSERIWWAAKSVNSSPS
jgi:pyruvate/2-oxoglutarate dehydrogenase complex dihydrolipoamide dehydrogenase (E3) component